MQYTGERIRSGSREFAEEKSALQQTVKTENGALSEQMKELQEEMDHFKYMIEKICQIEQEKFSLQQQLDQLTAQKAEAEEQVQTLIAKHEALKMELSQVTGELEQARHVAEQDNTEQIRALERELRIANSRLQHIYDSDMYRLSRKYYRIRDKIFPRDSWQYRAAKKCVRLLKSSRAKRGVALPSGSQNQIDLLHQYGKYERMDIVTTQHTLFIAKLMKKMLDQISIACEIHVGEPESYLDIPYVIICPQFVKNFPKVYFAMQMEQTVSSRWFTPDYFRTLQNSCVILDYALSNVEFFHKPENQDVRSRVYYLPIDYYANYYPYAAQEKEYDVLFYGDARNERRQKVLKELSKRFKVKLCSELFGDELYQEIRKAKVVVNIHYYENALLETTRLFEVLSLNSSMIVSEDSKGCEEAERLKDFVDFVPTDDLNMLINRVSYWVKHDKEREARVRQNMQQLENRANAFQFFFYRFLLAHDRISFDKFYELAGDYVQLRTNRLCLSLPESTERRRSFDEDNHYGFQCVPGLRHEMGWIGCGMSYKFMFKKAFEAKMKNLMICEDDVIFPKNFAKSLENATKYLNTRKQWSVFSGVMADVGKVKVNQCELVGKQRYIEIDHMVSMVFNIYNQSMFQYMCQWDETNRNVESNAIDRYLQNKKLYIFTQLPFMVGHKEELNSTIWGFSNVQYAEMIANSENKLKQLADQFENSKKK